MNVVNSASSIWRADVLTLFPEIFPGPLGFSLAGRALEKKIWECRTHDLRESGFGVHRNVDDAPFGGGAGMVLRADVLDGALGKIRRGMAGTPARPPVYFTPRGIPLTQEHIADFARGPGAILICGRFEGVDERFLRRRGVQEFSLGDFVLSGGEIPALAFLDGCVRLLPEVMGSPESSVEESFADGLLEYPQFTRPSVWEGEAVPEVLTSGDHGAVARWRKKQAEETTRERRPDLWAVYRKTQKTA